MKIGIISDTHIKNAAACIKIKEFINRYFCDVDILIHAGDYSHSSVVYTLKELKNFTGVWGNVDNDSIRMLVKEKEIISLEEYRIGIYHGHGDEKTTVERAYAQFKHDNIDIIIFGHSHQPIIKTKNGILMLNPGSCTTKRKERWFTYIILNIENRKISANLVCL